MDKAEAAKHRERLLEIRDRMTSQLDLVENAIPEHVTHPGEVTNLPTHLADHDAEGVDREIAVAHAETAAIQDIDRALQQIDDGSFGQCQQCQRPIAPERLAAIPYTPYCIECARQIESAAEADQDTSECPA
jgi:RNA polymerase-binding transcription factor DksA